MPAGDDGPGAGGALRSILALLFVAGWGVLLSLALDPRVGSLGLRLAGWAGLGLLSVFVFPDRSLRSTRALLVAAPAFLLALASAAAVIAWRLGRSGPPGPSDLVFPALGIVLGTAVGLALRRGPWAFLLLPFKLVVVAVLALLPLSVLLALSLESEPLAGGNSRSTESELAQLRGLLRDHDPRAVPPGESRTLRLSQPDTERLLSVILSRHLLAPGTSGLGSDGVRVAVAFEQDGRVAVALSARAPWIRRWLNAKAAARVAVAQGRLALGSPRARLGTRELPPPALERLAPFVAAALEAERPLRPLLAATRELKLEQRSVSVTYGRVDRLPAALVALLWPDRS